MYSIKVDKDIYNTDEGFYVYLKSNKATPYKHNLPFVMEYFKNKVPDVFLDIGGHHGTFAIPFSRIFKKVYTFEPFKPNYDILIKNIKQNHRINIVAFNKGISNENCKINIVKHSENSGTHTAFKNKDGSIDCITIDSLNLKNVDMIKVDVEGSEFNVIKGGINTIRKCRPLLQIECNSLSKQLHGVDNQK